MIVGHLGTFWGQSVTGKHFGGVLGHFGVIVGGLGTLWDQS